MEFEQISPCYILIMKKFNRVSVYIAEIYLISYYGTQKYSSNSDMIFYKYLN
jgi:hypothetical protein